VCKKNNIQNPFTCSKYKEIEQSRLCLTILAISKVTQEEALPRLFLPAFSFPPFHHRASLSREVSKANSCAPIVYSYPLIAGMAQVENLHSAGVTGWIDNAQQRPEWGWNTSPPGPHKTFSAGFPG
jgi:hypothetical protein